MDLKFQKISEKSGNSIKNELPYKEFQDFIYNNYEKLVEQKLKKQPYFKIEEDEQELLIYLSDFKDLRFCVNNDRYNSDSFFVLNKDMVIDLIKFLNEVKKYL